MKYIKITGIIVLSIFMAVMISSCDSLLDINAQDVVEESESYQNVYDADNAIWGLYSKFSKLAENTIVLNELRADMMDVTPNATADQVALNNHTATVDNKYCDPTPFYEVILNANDLLANLDSMKIAKRITADDYAPRYSDVMAIRTWTYLQLGIHYGTVPYINKPISNKSDLSNPSLYVEKTLDELILQLINDMQSVPTLAENTLSSFYNKTIQENGKSFFLNLQFINKRLILGDLYLWNDQFVEAATQYKAYMDEADANSSKTQMKNKISTWVWNSSNEPRFQICYQRYKDQDVSSFRNMWKEIFSRSSTEVGSSTVVGLQDEMIWMFSYSGITNSTSPFIKLFANTGVGEYQLKPSAWAVDSMWGTQVQQSNGFVFDGRGKESSYDVVNGQPVVLKYLYDYYDTYTTDANKTIHLDYNNITNKYSLAGKWFLYRAALLHLRYAEAANRAGYPRLAYALLNNGIKTNYDWVKSDGTYRANKEGVQYTSFQPPVPPAGATQAQIDSINAIPATPYPA
ncbi:MAG: RagB/SusD family nutrient uptake outer membrane protein, partial [Paludibacter sp.]